MIPALVSSLTLPPSQQSAKSNIRAAIMILAEVVALEFGSISATAEETMVVVFSPMIVDLGILVVNDSRKDVSQAREIVVEILLFL